jgi:hypothetical protein
MMSTSREGGISEVIGFILILAAITVALSLYLLYMMPAMGRENEIHQMSEAKARFTEYKVDIDTLWTSRQCSTAFGPAISLGAGETGGLLSFFPFLQPLKTSPVLALNQRDEYITIASDSYVTINWTGGYNDTGSFSTSPTNINVNNPPQYFFIDISSSDLTVPRGALIQGANWSAWVNITPRYDFYRRYSMTTDPVTNYVTSFTNWNEAMLTRTDVTIYTFKGGAPLVADLAVYKGITGSTVYSVDLMNPAYGISTELENPQTLSVQTSDSTITAGYRALYGYLPNLSSTTSAMGSLEFRSNNYYYVPQTYYYQLGGVFLEQQDGATMEVPPSISISMVNAIPVVKIGKILFWGNIMDTSMGGSGPVTVATAVTDISDSPLVPGYNTRWVNLSIQAASTSTAQMWWRTLCGIADQGGLPPTLYTNGTTGNVAFLNITGNPQLYDIQLSLTQVNVSGDYIEDYPTGGLVNSWRSLQGFRPLPPPTTPIPTPPAIPTAPPPPAGTTPVFVQSEAQGPGVGSSASITLPSASQSGNFTVVSFVVEPQTLSVANVSDSKGNTYFLAIGPTPISDWGELYTYYASNIIGGGDPITITISFSGPCQYETVYAAEYSGIKASGPLDQIASSYGSSAVLDSGSRTTTQAKELIYGFAVGDQPATVDPPYNQRENLDGNFIADQIVSATGSYHVTGTLSTSNWACQMATFKGA